MIDVYTQVYNMLLSSIDGTLEAQLQDNFKTLKIKINLLNEISCL